MFQLPPSIQRFVFPVLALLVLVGSWHAYGLPGIALAASVLLMVVLLHFTRLMHILRKAADRPLGHVPSAVMLNAKLKPGVNLVHVMAMTRSLGELRTPRDTQPEVFRWTDNTQSWVDCEFRHGRLVRWELTRPDAAAPAERPAATPAAEPAPVELPRQG